MDAAVDGQRNAELTLREALQLLYSNRWLISAVTLVFALTAALAAMIVSKKYTASIVVSPSTESGTSQLNGLGQIASQFGGLASLAGMSLGDNSKSAEAVAVLQSEALTERYITENGLLPILFKDRWDTANHKWKRGDPKSQPTPWEANQKFRDIRNVTTETKSGLVTMTITWTDPTLAAKWANDLVKLTNDYLRSKALERSERNIAYLNEQATKTDVLPIKQGIYTLLQTEINKAMLARGSNEYAFKILDPAAIPERQSSPIWLVWTAVGLLGGLLLSVLGVLLRAALKA